MVVTVENAALHRRPMRSELMGLQDSSNRSPLKGPKLDGRTQAWQ